MRQRRPHALAFATAGILALSLTACSRNAWLDLAMNNVPHVPPPIRRNVGPYQVLAGDLHCHIAPPDSPAHVSRELPETVRLATEEGLDFVVLAPHVPARFFLDPEQREWVRGTQTVLRAKVEAFASSVLLVPGMEYTDHRYGHVGLSFANVDEVLDEIPINVLAANPSLFFERWQAHGGIANIHHPTDRPIAAAPIAELRYDMSWRGFAIGGSTAPPVPVFPEIAWLSDHADAVEIYNLSISYLRDQYFLHDADWTLRETAHLVERESRRQERRIAPVGGSDSHGGWMRPTTWVLATERTRAGVRDAIVAGRTCVRGPEACSLEARGADGAFHVVGASIAAARRPRSGSSEEERTVVEARASGGPVTYYVNGDVAATGADGETVDVPVPGRCALLRAIVGRSWSAPVYVDCAWASASSARHLP